LSAHWHKAFDYLTCYILYTVLVLLGVVVAFGIWRLTIIALIAAFIGPSHVNAAIYMTSMIVLGLSTFVLLLAAEPYLRQQLWRRFARLATPLGIAGLIGMLLDIWLVTAVIRP
jgi:hypothetical protein